MKQIIKILRRLLELQSEVARNALSLTIRFPYQNIGDDSLDNFAYYQAGIETICSLIQRRDLKDLSWMELQVLVKATNRGDKLRAWVCERQKSFPQIVSEESHEKDVADFEIFYATKLLEI